MLEEIRRHSLEQLIREEEDEDDDDDVLTMDLSEEETEDDVFIRLRKRHQIVSPQSRAADGD